MKFFLENTTQQIHVLELKSITLCSQYYGRLVLLVIFFSSVIFSYRSTTNHTSRNHAHKHAEKLFALAQEPKQLMTVSGPHIKAFAEEQLDPPNREVPRPHPSSRAQAFFMALFPKHLQLHLRRPKRPVKPSCLI